MRGGPSQVSAAVASIYPYPIRWVTVDRYCELRGDTVKAVRCRRAAGKWVDGIHTMVRDRRLYVNLPEADQWVERK